ncbi:cupin domain-containing protein [Cupriavidus pinatubonensis]|nr:cupin domain-containing protein [Cupriavidus pinatubonensis]TPQ39268.1 cupin [Cupriavidus pinatubonensis]
MTPSNGIEGGPVSDDSHDAPQTVVAVHPDREISTMQKLPYFVGISRQTAGARGLSMSVVVVPPGGHAEPHIHRGYETGIYVLEGRVETRYGPGLRQSVVTEAGDFLFIPPGVPHQPFNLSKTAPARAIVARDSADEREEVEPYEPETGV